MKILNTIIEFFTSPFTFLLRKGGGKHSLFQYGKAFIIAIVSIIIVVGLILLFYRDFIF